MADAPRSSSAKSVLRGQAIAFFGLLGLMWIAELIHLPYLLFGDSPEWMWRRLALRTTALLIIWLLVHRSTARLLKRLHELETFLRICSWCRKVDDKGEWRTMEAYFDARFHTTTSHGICPACAREQFDKHIASARKKIEPKARS